MVNTLARVSHWFVSNARDPKLRKKVAILMVGKLIGLGIVLMIITTVVPRAVHAAGLGDAPTPEINAINTAWTLIAAFLVFCMQVGFEMLEAGFARSREGGKILVGGIAATCVWGTPFWAWGPDGWLAVMQPLGFRDFAGSTVVHTIGGAISLVGAIVLGPRLGRIFKRDGGGPMPAHDIIIGACGGLILWFGWYGFNPGSTLSAMDIQGIGRVSFNTTLAACSAGMTALLISYFRGKKWDLGLSVNGFLAGLVAITCPCYWVDPVGAFFIGIGGGIVVIWGIDLLEWFRIDDPIGAVPVHMVAGIWGTLSLGLFASGAYGVPTPTGFDTSTVVTGLFYGGGFGQLIAQAIGSASITLATLAVTFVLMYAVKATGTLRISLAGEIEGIDIHEHGAPRYPEIVTHGKDGTPRSVEEAHKLDRGKLPVPSASAGD